MKLYFRSGEFDFAEDGRTLEGKWVPYEEPTTVVDFDEETHQLVRYQEQFLRHSLAAMAQGFHARGGRFANGQFIPLLVDHNDRFDAMIGHAIDLRSEDDGAYGAFRLYDDANIVKVRSILTESHRGLSLAFRDVKPPRIIDGITSRVQVFVGHVAATPSPAYQNAGITALRSIDLDPPTLETPKLAGVREWLAANRPKVEAPND